MQDWAKAEADFRQVGNMGHKLFDGGYKQLFKEANEQSDEAIFSLQCIDNNETADGNSMSFRYGGRTTFGSCWNTILASTDFVDTYENIDGSKFNWDDYLPGYSSMEPKDREVFFLRNTDADVLKAELLSLGYEGDIDAAIKGIREKVENRLSKLSTAAQALYQRERPWQYGKVSGFAKGSPFGGQQHDGRVGNADADGKQLNGLFAEQIDQRYGREDGNALEQKLRAAADHGGNRGKAFDPDDHRPEKQRHHQGHIQQGGLPYLPEARFIRVKQGVQNC